MRKRSWYFWLGIALNAVNLLFMALRWNRWMLVSCALMLASLWCLLSADRQWREAGR